MFTKYLRDRFSGVSLLINSAFFMNFTAHSDLYGADEVCSGLLYYTMQKDLE